MRKHWQPLHGIALDAITRRDIVTAMDEIAAARGKSAADRAKASLSGFFVWALDRNYCEVNPVLGIRRRGGNGSRERVLTPAELVDIWKSCEDTDYGRIVKLLLLTGARRNEIANLLWSEINLEKREIELPGERTKNGYPHAVAISDQALEILQSVIPSMAAISFSARAPLDSRDGARPRLLSTPGSTSAGQIVARSLSPLGFCTTCAERLSPK